MKSRFGQKWSPPPANPDPAQDAGNDQASHNDGRSGSEAFSAGSGMAEPSLRPSTTAVSLGEWAGAPAPPFRTTGTQDPCRRSHNACSTSDSLGVLAATSVASQDVTNRESPALARRL